MADTPPLRAVPDPEDPTAEDLDVDPADLAFVRSQLAGLSDLRPEDAPAAAGDDDAPTATTPMPSWVWDSLSTALAAQPPVGTPSPTTTTVDDDRRAHRGSPARRWAGGLVAAGVAVIAVGIAATVLRTGGGSVIAGDAAQNEAAAAAKLTAPSASAFGLEQAEQAAPVAASAAADAPPQAGAPRTEPTPAVGEAAASTVAAQPAARMVLDSQTDYRAGDLPAQVVSLVKQAGFATLRDAVSKQMPTPAMPVEDGFTASWEQLRDCITWLTSSAQGQALVVDRGTYDGHDAGVVVAPAELGPPIAAADAAPGPDPNGEVGGEPTAAPLPSATIQTPVGVFDVWVVDPQCEQVAASLDDFALYAWRP